MEHTELYFKEVIDIVLDMNLNKIDSLANILSKVRGRVFIIGVGGSAANASHMVNDLRKLCHIEAYAPTDNVSELSARTNDEGFETVFQSYLETSKFSQNDVLFVLSVGGGSQERNVSVNIIKAINYAKSQNGIVLGITGKSDGYLATNADEVVIVPSVNPDRITPHSEAFQAVVWHCLVSNPLLQKQKTKW
jgi:D-sedoheptulose 7-phosphate isomerase